MTQSKSKKSKEYLFLVSQLACCITGQWPVNVHHPREGQGMAMKAPDWWAIPLTPDMHQYGENAIHRIGVKAWRKKYGSELDHARRIQAMLKDKIEIPKEFLL